MEEIDQAVDDAQQVAEEGPQATDEFEVAQEIALNLWDQAQLFLTGLLRPWNAYQVAIVIGVFALAYCLSRFFGPKLREWLRTREGWPKWRMRFGVVVHRRLTLIIFAGLIWPLYWGMQEFTWPSRSYLIGIGAQLGLAWLAIALVTRLIVNGFIRSVVRYAAWIWVTLSIMGLTEDAQRLLHSAALQIGETRISLWMVLQAIVVIGALIFIARFLSRTTASKIKSNKEISPSMQVLAVKFLQVILYGAAFFLGLRAIGVDLTGLAFLSGAIGLGLGFGLQ